MLSGYIHTLLRWHLRTKSDSGILWFAASLDIICEHLWPKSIFSFLKNGLRIKRQQAIVSKKQAFAWKLAKTLHKSNPKVQNCYFLLKRKRDRLSLNLSVKYKCFGVFLTQPMSRTASEDGWRRTKATQAAWNASVVGMSRRNPIHFRNVHWTGRNCCLPPPALFSLYAPISLLRAYLHLTFLFGARRARFHEAVFRQEKLSRCLVACAHSLTTSGY